MTDKVPLIRFNPIPDETMNSLLKPAANSIGIAFADLLDGAFNFALNPVRKYNLTKDKDLADFADKINQGTNKIPEENRDSSKIGLVLKALEDSRYQLDKEEIRKLFSNLISNALDNRKNEFLHPKFSQILSEMTPREAELLAMFFENNSALPSGNILRRKVNEQSFNSNKLTYLLLEGKKFDKSGLEFDIIDRSYGLELALLEATNIINKSEFRLSGEANYRLYHFFEISVEEEYRKKEPDYEFVTQKSFYQLTELGESFCKFVLQ